KHVWLRLALTLVEKLNSFSVTFDAKIFFANFQKLLTKLLGIFIISSFAHNSKTAVGGFLTRNSKRPLFSGRSAGSLQPDLIRECRRSFIAARIRCPAPLSSARSSSWPLWSGSDMPYKVLRTSPTKA